MTTLATPPLDRLTHKQRIQATQTKPCNGCKRWLPLDEFRAWERASDGSGRAWNCRECRSRIGKIIRSKERNTREAERQAHILRTLNAEHGPRIHLQLVDECLRWFGGPAGFAEEVARWYEDAVSPTGRTARNLGRGAPDSARKILRAVLRIVELSEVRREEYEREAAEFARWVDEL